MFTERTQVLLSKQQLRELKQRAKREKKSVGAVIREAVDAYAASPMDEERRTALAHLVSLELPVEDWSVMKAQILAGALGQAWDPGDDVP